MTSRFSLLDEAEARLASRELRVAATRDILVVDDSPANIIAVEAALAPLGRRIVTARSGPEALSRVLQEDFALIFLDVQMPGMDGFETAQLIRGRERSRHIPIIFVTAFQRDDEAVLRAYRLGAVDFLFKPIQAEVLRAKAAVFIDLQDRTAELAERRLDLQRRQLEEEALHREMEQLALADRRKDEFLAILAHELRNPLAPIQTSIELTRRDPEHRVSPRVLDILERQLRHLRRLVDDLLDVSRITAGKIELREEVLAIGDLVDQAVAASRPVIDANRHVLEVTPGPGEVLVAGDPVRIVQVITNIITNAAKFTDRGGRIAIAWGRDDRGVFIRITDNGRGIPAPLLGRVFDMFVQERVGTDGAGGLGLGLALAKRLMELHGGSIHAESEGPGKGSTFEVRLPATLREPSLRLPVATAPPTLVRTLRAVVIDDNPDIREVLADLLTTFGHDVATASDGPSGLALIREEKPDVALVDLGLPGLDGYDIARTVRRELADQRPRLVAMTGYGREQDRIRALEAGFDVHLVKPATADAIRLALDDAPRSKTAS